MIKYVKVRFPLQCHTVRHQSVMALHVHAAMSGPVVDARQLI